MFLVLTWASLSLGDVQLPPIPSPCSMYIICIQFGPLSAYLSKDGFCCYCEFANRSAIGLARLSDLSAHQTARVSCSIGQSNCHQWTVPQKCGNFIIENLRLAFFLPPFFSSCAWLALRHDNKCDWSSSQTFPSVALMVSSLFSSVMCLLDTACLECLRVLNLRLQSATPRS